MAKKNSKGLDQFKMEAASEVGVNLKSGYNGDLTAREAGSIGGQMVNIICPERPTIIHRANWKSPGQKIKLIYETVLSF